MVATGAAHREAGSGLAFNDDSQLGPLFNKHHHHGGEMTQLTKQEALVAAAAVQPVCAALENLLDNPVLQLPDGIVDWEKAEEVLRVHRTAYAALVCIASDGGAGQ